LSSCRAAEARSAPHCGQIVGMDKVAMGGAGVDSGEDMGLWAGAKG